LSNGTMKPMYNLTHKLMYNLMYNPAHKLAKL